MDTDALMIRVYYQQIPGMRAILSELGYGLATSGVPAKNLIDLYRHLTELRPESHDAEVYREALLNLLSVAVKVCQPRRIE